MEENKEDNKQVEQVEDTGIEKPKKKVNYVYTDARRQHFENARAKRAENIAKRKEDKLKQEYEEMQIKKINEEVKSDDEIKEFKQQIKTVKKIVKPPTIVYESDSSNDSDSSVEYIVKKTSRKKKNQQVVQQPIVQQPIVQQPIVQQPVVQQPIVNKKSLKFL